MSCRPGRLKHLTGVLRRAYPARHRIVLYEAAQFPICEPVIRRVALGRLSRARVRPVTTIYVPPLPDRPVDTKIMQWFEDDER
jgi:hypothetical protein